ncbi:MAG: peptidase [Promethearchaeota archaeon CR_4]|nr:MAG: peptidase [Candidatus Lokiarchaeota archaeon CR_4]
MKTKRWQAIIFVTWMLLSLIGASLALTFSPRVNPTIQTMTKHTSTSGAQLTGQILHEKYDTALRSRLQIGIGEKENLNVIILLDSQDPQANAAKKAVLNMGGAVTYEYHLFPGIVANVPAMQLSNLADSPVIARVCLDRIEQLPGDTTPIPAAIDTNNWWRIAVGADNPALAGITGSNVKIAILDTGLGYVGSNGSIRYHADFAGRVISAENFAAEDGVIDPNDTADWYGHGTHTAGIVVGSGIASGGKYAGIAPGASLLVGKVLNSSGGGEFSDILKGVEWAVDNGAQIISMSLGGDLPEVFTLEGYAIQNATEHGALIIASAGNGGPDYFTGALPGSSLYTLSVAASDRNNNLADFSSAGPTLAMQAYPSITAPGVDIIAPLGIESAIEREMVYLENIITGSEGSDYVPLSGTSMAAPIAAGVAALLLEYNTSLNPLALRAILMESATDLGESLERQGAGLINAANARTYIDNILARFPTNVNNLTCVYPEEVPFAPYDLLNFPGDAQTMNLTVVSGTARNVSIDLPTSIAGVKVSSSQSSLNFTIPGVQLWNLSIMVEWNASIGQRVGTINFTDSQTGELLDQVTLDFTVKLPKKRVFFDSFHGANDYFNALPYGTTQLELYNFAKVFIEKNYSVDLKMEYWTPEYVPARDGRLLTYDLLQNYDAVVLQTPFLPYTLTEIQALVNFHNNGGSILVVGDRYQSLALDSVNTVLARLGTGISFFNTNFEAIQFYGFYGLRNVSTIDAAASSDPMLTNVEQLLFDWGAILSVTGTGTSVLTADTSSSTIVAKTTGMGIAGNVVVLSGPSLLTNTYMIDPVIGGNHAQFASNLIDYLLPNQAFNIARRCTPERSEDGTTAIYLYVTDGTTGLPVTGLKAGETLNLTSSNPAILDVVDFVNVTEMLLPSGIYVNASYSLLLGPSTSPYFLNTSANVNTVLRNATGAVIWTTPTPPRFSTISQNKDEIDRNPTSSSGLLSVSLTNATSLSNLQLYAGSAALSAFNVKAQYSFTKSVSYSGGSEFNTLLDARGHTSGLYAYFYEGNNSAGYTNIYSQRSSFIVVNYDPVIDETLSYFGKISFDTMKTDDDRYIIQTARQLNTYSFSVSTTDEVDYEDSDNQLTGVVVFFPVYELNGTLGLLIGNGRLPWEDYSYNAGTGQLEGQITIPRSVTYPKGDGTNIVKSTVSSGNYMAILEIVVMDTEGGSTDYVVILNLMVAPPSLTVIFIIVGIIGGVAVLALILAVRHRARQRGYGTRYQSPYESSNASLGQMEYGYAPQEQVFPPPNGLRKFCISCGQPIPIEAKQCPHCGGDNP